MYRLSCVELLNPKKALSLTHWGGAAKNQLPCFLILLKQLQR